MDTNEIVREIAEVIRLGNPAAAGCEVEISDMIGQLQRPHSPAFGYRKNNKKYAADIIKWIEEGQRLLRGRPDTIHPALLFRQMGLHDWGNLLFFGEQKPAATDRYAGQHTPALHCDWRGWRTRQCRT